MTAGKIQVECTTGGEMVLASPGWPESILITQRLLETAEPKYIQVGGGEFMVSLANAHATYRILGRAGGYPTDVWACQLIEGEPCL
jgi:hypothetical protein